MEGSEKRREARGLNEAIAWILVVSAMSVTNSVLLGC